MPNTQPIDVTNSAPPFLNRWRNHPLRNEREWLFFSFLIILTIGYAAFAMGDVDYLDRTQHPEHIDQAHPAAERRRRISAFCRAARFPGLKIIDVAADGDDALVLFVARVFVGRDDDSFAECSRFRKYGTEWRYLEGDLDDDVSAGANFASVAAFVARPRRQGDEAAMPQP